MTKLKRPLLLVVACLFMLVAAVHHMGAQQHSGEFSHELHQKHKAPDLETLHRHLSLQKQQERKMHHEHLLELHARGQDGDLVWRVQPTHSVDEPEYCPLQQLHEALLLHVQEMHRLIEQFFHPTNPLHEEYRQGSTHPIGVQFHSPHAAKDLHRTIEIHWMEPHSPSSVDWMEPCNRKTIWM